MSRIDWLILNRVVSRVTVVSILFYGIFVLVLSLDTYLSSKLSEAGGPVGVAYGFAIFGARTLIDTLPVPVLIGTILAALDLQVRRELMIIKASGLSVWRLLRAPLVFAILVGLVAALVAAPVIIRLSSGLPVSINAPSGSPSLWFEERNQDGDYILTAEHAARNGTELEGVTAFLSGYPDHGRIEAPAALLEPGAWAMETAVRYLPNRPPEKLTNFRLATQTTAGDLRVHFTLARDLNVIELYRAISAGISDSSARAGVLTSLIRQLCLPALLAGMVLIGFAFTSGYRRTNRYGAAVLYGVVLGFVVYVITELATRAGAAGVVEPTFAAAGPAFVAIVIGLTVLLFREDGRA